MRTSSLLQSIAVLALSFLVSCGGGNEPGDAANGAGVESGGSSKVIGYSMLSSANPFFKVIARSMTEAAEEQGYTVVAVSGDLDLEKQRQQVDDFIARKVAAIVLNPCDSKGIGPVIEKANAAGIPVFTCDIKSLATTGKVEAHIATDNFAGGRQAGQAMIEALGEAGGKIAIIDYKDAESCLLRVAGFKEVIDAFNNEHPDARFEIVRELGGEGDLEKGRTAAQDIIQAVPDLDGIFAINDPSGLGAWSALNTAGKADDVVLIGFDGQPDGKKAVQSGKFYASPIQFPSMMGKQTIATIVKYFNGESIEAEQLIPPRPLPKGGCHERPRHRFLGDAATADARTAGRCAKLARKIKLLTKAGTPLGERLESRSLQRRLRYGRRVKIIADADAATKVFQHIAGGLVLEQPGRTLLFHRQKSRDNAFWPGEANAPSIEPRPTADVTCGWEPQRKKPPHQ